MKSEYPMAHKIIIPKPYSREATVHQTIAKERERLRLEKEAASNVRQLKRQK